MKNHGSVEVRGKQSADAASFLVLMADDRYGFTWPHGMHFRVDAWNFSLVFG